MSKAQATVEFVLAVTLAITVFTILGLALDRFVLNENQAEENAIDYLLDDFQAKVEYVYKSKTDVVYNFTFPEELNHNEYNITFQNYSKDKRSYIAVRINSKIRDTYRYLPLVENYTPLKPGIPILLRKNDSGVFLE